MLRNLSIHVRLLLSGITAVSSIVCLASLAIYSLWQSELELERQISVTDAVRQELTADLKHEAIEGLVVNSLLEGGPHSNADQAALKAELAEEAEVLLASLENLKATELHPDIMALIAAAMPLTEAYIASAQDLQAQGFRDRAAALAVLPSFLQEFAALKQALTPLGQNIEELIASDLEVEYKAVPELREFISLCEKKQDYVTRDILKGILDSEEEHIDWLETHLQLIEKVGLQNYLQSQMGDAE